MIKYTSLIFFFFITILFSNEDNFVFSIKISGNNKFENSFLKDKIRLKERGFLSKSEFNKKKLQLDEITLENFYRTHGFNDIEIISKYNVFQGTDIIIDFLIIEGDQYKVKKINFDGLRIFEPSDVYELIDIKPGDVYNPAKIRRNLKNLVNNYLENGKLNISIVEDINFESNLADINILVSEGSTFSIKNINIIGLVDVESKYIHRELLISEGMIYDVNLITKSREQIFESGLFSSVEIEPHIINNNLIDLNIKIREYKSREIGAEIGFDQLPSTEGDLPISAINTKLQWRLGQLLNTTASIRLNTEIGLSYYRTNSFTRQYYEAFYNSPWFLDIRIPLNLKIYYENITQTQSLRRFGINTSFTYYNNNNTKLSGNLKTEFIKSTDIDEAEERSINFFFTKHSIENHLYPKNGYYLSVNPSLHGTFLGGNFHYIKFDTEFKYFYTIFGNIVLANRFKIGKIEKITYYMNDDYDIPAFDKFQLGGQTSLRGWSSPKDFENGESNGSMDRYLFNTEIRFPLYVRLGGVIFYDAGLFDNPNDKTKYGWNTGFGLTFNTGLGPVRVDTAYKKSIGKPNILFSLLYMF